MVKDEFYSEDNIPAQILACAEQVLAGTCSANPAYQDLNNKYYDWMTGLELNSNRKILLTCQAIYQSLVLVLEGVPGLRYYDRLDNNFCDDDINLGQNDAISMAMKAFCLIDNNKDRHWYYFDKPPVPIYYSASKRLKFWEWWLTTAIPRSY